MKDSGGNRAVLRPQALSSFLPYILAVMGLPTCSKPLFRLLAVPRVLSPNAEDRAVSSRLGAPRCSSRVCLNRVQSSPMCTGVCSLGRVCETLPCASVKSFGVQLGPGKILENGWLGVLLLGPCNRNIGFCTVSH